MHPKVLIERQETQFGPNKSHDGTADGKQNEHAIHAEDQTGTSRDPYRVLKSVQTRQSVIGSLLPPKRELEKF
jgi:hypothetical protein